MRLSGSRRPEALSGPPPRRRPWRIRFAALISLLIHLAIGVLLFVTIRHEGQPELLPPPSPVTMVFEAGRKKGPTLPNPQLQTSPSPPSTPPAEGVPLPTPPLPAPPEPPAAAPAPTVPAPSKPPAPPAPAPVPAEPPALPKPSPAVPPAPPPPPPAEVKPQLPLPPAERAPAPRPPPVLKPLPAPKLPPARTPPRAAASSKPPAFPAPMNFSFGKPNFGTPSPAKPRSTPHIPGTIDMSLGPASRGTADLTPLSKHDADAAGADWRNELSRWVADHAYYPEQARRDEEEGDVKVRVLANPDGKVKEVELIGRSGSMWLDLALQALFRDQYIPALPSGDHDPIEFNFTMHYVLIRPR